MYYWAIVRHDEGSAYGVSFPDVPDCFAAADEEQDVMAAAIDALDDYFADGFSPPQPLGLDATRSRYTKDLAGGAYLIQVPLIVRDGQSVRFNVSMERGLLGAIDEAAERLKMTRSAFLAQAARREITDKVA